MKLTKSQLLNIIQEELKEIVSGDPAYKGTNKGEKWDSANTMVQSRIRHALASKDAAALELDQRQIDRIMKGLYQVIGDNPHYAHMREAGDVLSFPGRDGDTHKMYAADDELRELGDKISEMVVLSRQVDELMLDMGMRYGELAVVGTNARTAKTLIKKLEDIFNQKLDDIERFSK